MPFVQVSSEVRLHYEISLCDGDDALQASLRPWLMIVHPLLMDSSYVKSFSEEPVLRSTFNQVLFDARHHGRSTNPTSKAIDLYTIAADFAIGLENSKSMPFTLLELILARVSSSEHFRSVFESFANPESVEEWDEGAGAVQWFNFGNPSLIERDILDEWASIVIRRYPPSRSVDCCLCVWPFLSASKASKPDYIPDGLRSEANLPILFLTGDNDTISTAAGSQQRLDELPFHEYSTVKTLKGHPKETLAHYMDWVKDILEGKYSNNKGAEKSACLQSSLEKIALNFKNESIMKRDPMQSDSYNRNTEEENELFEEVLRMLNTRQVNTFSLFGGGGPEMWTGASFKEIVPWRFSSRFDEARLSVGDPVFQHTKHDCEAEAIEIKTSVEVCHQDLVGI
ncbi:hypothetical protein H4Q26_010393 [Puccinia striiformis f. sp. tritici PST-130]|nr:hypothetical protein H4Q26_010393 [Puccinia striiformis f. sp. tritici PST-130]